MRGKRFLSFLLAVVLMLTLIPVPVQAAKGGKLIALTFDDGPHRTYTKQLLDGLKTRGVNVTFFMVGSNAASYSNLVQRAYDEGHEIGNHTYSHPNLNTLGRDSVISQLNSTAAVLDKSCGSGTDYLVRPPYGNANATVLSAMGSPAIIWSVDTNDWKYRNSDHVYNHIVNNASDGAIVLCHDIYSTTVSGALRAVDTLLARGYEFVTVSELYRRRGVTLQDGVKYYSCKNNGTDLGPVEKPVITYAPEADGVRITISSPSGAPVYYTLNGSRFNQQSTRYTGSFVTKTPVEIQAIAAFDLNGDRSETTTFKLTLLPCAAPDIMIGNGLVTLDCSTSGVPIYYTIDGSKATTSSNRYTGAVAINPGTTVRAVAGGGNYLVSPEVIRHYSANGNVFSDVFPYEWYYNAIDKLAATGLMYGVGNDSFAPGANTTRAMLVAILYRYSGETLEDGWTRTNTFTDVEDGIWYSEAVEWAYRNGIVAGYTDNTFRHDQAITREEMTRVFAEFMSYRGISLDTETNRLENFRDGSQIQEWAVDSVNAIVSAGLMVGDGDGYFNPGKAASRAEAGAVLIRLMDLEEAMEEVPEEIPEEETEEVPEEEISEGETEEVPEEEIPEGETEKVLEEEILGEEIEEIPEEEISKEEISEEETEESEEKEVKE